MQNSGLKKHWQRDPLYPVIMEKILEHLSLSGVTENYQENIWNRLTKTLLLSLTFFMNGAAWRFAADIWGSSTKYDFKYYACTGIAAGPIIFAVCLLDFLKNAYSLYKGKLFRVGFLESCLPIIGNAVLYGSAATVSNFSWQPLVNWVGGTEWAYLTTGFGCTTAFFAALVVASAIHRVALLAPYKALTNTGEEDKFISYCMEIIPAVSGFYEDVKDHLKFCLTHIITVASFFCLTLFKEMFVIPGVGNPFQIAPIGLNSTSTNGTLAAGLFSNNGTSIANSDTYNRFLNPIKAGASVFFGFWVGFAILEILVKQIVNLIRKRGHRNRLSIFSMEKFDSKLNNIVRETIEASNETNIREHQRSEESLFSPHQTVTNFSINNS